MISMSRIDIFNTACHFVTQTVAPNIPGFRISRYVFNIWPLTLANKFSILLIHMIDEISSDLHTLDTR